MKEGKDPDGGKPTVVFKNKKRAYLQQTANESVLEFNRRNKNEKMNVEPRVYDDVEERFLPPFHPWFFSAAFSALFSLV